MNTANISTSKNKCGGVPCLRNTRFPIHELLLEIATRNSLDEVAEELNLDADSIKGALEDISDHFLKGDWLKKSED
jgi:uncharacterized protein (DUF433 family)